MTEQKSPPVDFLMIPSVHITGASVCGFRGDLLRVTLVEGDAHSMQPRGSFVGSFEAWEGIANVIKNHRAALDALKAQNSAQVSAPTDASPRTH